MSIRREPLFINQILLPCEGTVVYCCPSANDISVYNKQKIKMIIDKNKSKIVFQLTKYLNWNMVLRASKLFSTKRKNCKK